MYMIFKIFLQIRVSKLIKKEQAENNAHQNIPMKPYQMQQQNGGVTPYHIQSSGTANYMQGNHNLSYHV